LLGLLKCCSGCGHAPAASRLAIIAINDGGDPTRLRPLLLGGLQRFNRWWTDGCIGSVRGRGSSVWRCRLDGDERRPLVLLTQLFVLVLRPLLLLLLFPLRSLSLLLTFAVSFSLAFSFAFALPLLLTFTLTFTFTFTLPLTFAQTFAVPVIGTLRL
jgi:hypothetical protein